MKSTGEVLGIGKNLEEALYKGLVAAGYNMNKKGGVLVTVRDSDKHEIVRRGPQVRRVGLRHCTPLRAPPGRWKPWACGSTMWPRCSDGTEENTVSLMEAGKVSYVISTDSKGRLPQLDSVKMRRKTVELGIPCLTSHGHGQRPGPQPAEPLQPGDHRTGRHEPHAQNAAEAALHQNGGHAATTTSISTACSTEIPSPESISVVLSDRHFSIGGDGIIMILPSTMADAKMRIFNRDGSEGKMCGNGIRCVAKYLYEHDIVRKSRMTIETLSGVRSLHLYIQNGNGELCDGEHGQGHSGTRQHSRDHWTATPSINRPLEVAGQELRLSPVCPWATPTASPSWTTWTRWTLDQVRPRL